MATLNPMPSFDRRPVYCAVFEITRVPFITLEGELLHMRTAVLCGTKAIGLHPVTNRPRCADHAEHAENMAIREEGN